MEPPHLSRRRPIITPSRPDQEVPRRFGRPVDAAHALGISEKTVYRWLDTGMLTRYKLGPRLLRVDMDEVDRLMTVTPASVSP